MSEYKVIKFWCEGLGIFIWALQNRRASTWTTLEASTFDTDIKHACQSGRNSDAKMEAWRKRFES